MKISSILMNCRASVQRSWLIDEADGPWLQETLTKHSVLTGIKGQSGYPTPTTPDLQALSSACILYLN